jgi:hypothetical protein
MYSSRELIDALLARGRRGLSLRERHAERPPGEFPPGWRAWFASMHERVGAVTGATAEAIVAIFLARELAKPAPRSAELGRWQAFTALWRQQWHASGREPAYERVIALVVTLLAHLLLAILLLWIAWVRFMGLPAPAGEDVVQVEYIGEGTPEETGGGAPAAEILIEEPEAPADAAPPPPAATAAPSAVAEEPTPQPPEVPTPQPPAETPAPQPLQITETATPDSTFVLPPTTAPELALAVPEVRRPAVQTIEREVELVETPTPPAVRPQLIEQPVPPLEVPPREARVQTRTVPLLTPPQDVPRVAQQPQPAPQIEAPARQLQAREIPLSPAQGEQAAQRPSPAGQAPASTASRPGTATSSPSATAPASGRPADSSGDRPATAAGRGASPNAAPGAFPTPSRGDDWGESDRNVPGGNAGTDSGLFDADGRPRLPPGTAAPGGGFPPGSDDWTREQLDRHGTWATRPPLGYEPTRFDQYWIPSGTLLDEWVRRGIKNMSIPIPGTSKKISCVISILQLGGGCGITDPNLQDQEAIARPPPDIPYKPELQEPEQ